jgi:hypothetical protein
MSTEGDPSIQDLYASAQGSAKPNNGDPTIQELYANAPKPPPEPIPAIAGQIFNSPATIGGKLLGDFGMGFAQGFGTGPAGLNPETEEMLRKNGWFNDHQTYTNATYDAFTKGQIWPAVVAANRALNEEAFQDIAKAGNLVMRTGMGVIGGISAAAGGAAEETGIPQAVSKAGGFQYQPGQLGAEVAQGLQSEFMSPTGLHLPTERAPQFEATEISDARNAAINALNPNRPATTTAAMIPQAKAMGIIGSIRDDEGLWKGTVEGPYPAPAPEAARVADAQAGIPTPPAQAPESPTVRPQADIEAAARQIAPDAFAERDQLVTHQAFLRSEIGRFEQDRLAASTAEVDGKIKAIEDGVGGQVESLPEKQYNEYQALLDRRETITDIVKEEAAPEIAAARKQFQTNDERLRDLAPTVSDAYRRATEGEQPTVADSVEPVPEPAAAAADASPESEPATEKFSPPAPVEPGFVRFYHGGPPENSELPTSGGGRDVTPYAQYAEDYRSDGKRPGAVWYVDLPKDHPEEVAARNWDADDPTFTGTSQENTYHNSKVSEETAQGFKPYNEAAARAESAAKIPSKVGEPAPTAAAPINIADHVTQQLVAAGRPADEAAAAAQVIQAHYDARAERFGGQAGTASEMYQRDFPSITNKAKGGPKGAASGARKVLKSGQQTITLFGKADASTFLHETGHQWLEELMKDAEDERAPAELKADAAAVRKEIGADETGPISTRAHEKFARSFERYFMEGRAPSARLAGVFAQFKNWLNTIYSTVNRLGKPISSDIRDVFDRLLSKPSDRTAIVPEPAKEFADIHEADAEHTPPARAGAAADTIEHEVDQLAAERSPQIAEAMRGPEPTAGSGVGQPGTASPRGEPTPNDGASGGGREPEPVGAGQGPSGQSAAVSGRGGQAAAESAGAQPAKQLVPADRERPNVGSDPAKPETVAGPNTKLEKDLAGNTRLENLNTAAGVKAALRELADENGGYMDARRGVVSDQQVSDLAASMGLLPSDLNIDALRAQFSPEKMWATRTLLKQKGLELESFSKDAAAGDMVSIAKYEQARKDLAHVHEFLNSFTAEWGRTGRALRNMADDVSDAQDLTEFLGTPGVERTLFQIQQEAAKVAQFRTLFQIQKYTREVDQPGMGAMAEELFKNALISNPLTHVQYGVGNAILAVFKAVPETLAEAAFHSIKEAAGYEVTNRTYAGEAAAQLYALIDGQKRGIMAAWDSVKSGQTALLPGEERKAPALTNTKAIPDPTVGGVKLPIGSILRLPGERMVAPIHSYFRTIGYEQAISRLTFRQAMKEGLTGAARDQRIAQLTMKPSVEMMKEARAESSEQTLMANGGEFSRRVSSLVNAQVNIPLLGMTKPLAFIDPFTSISSNIINQTFIERSPLGILLSEKVRADLMGKNEIAQGRAAARIASGTSLAMLGGFLAAQGMITPSGPSTRAEAAIWQAEHGMPHSLRIGEMSYDLAHLGPLGMGLGISADAYHAFSMMGKEDASTVAAALAHSFSQNLLDQSFMKGPSDLIKALDNSDQYGPQYVRSFLTSAVPFSSAIGQMARTIDPYQRDARSMLDAFKAKIPWESETLQPRVDLWGQPLPNKDFVGVFERRIADDPVNKALLQDGQYPAMPKRDIVGVKLTEQQYHDYCVMSGQLAHQLLLPKVSSPAWAQIPVMMRNHIISSAIEGSRAMARGRLKIGSIGGDNDLIAEAFGIKQAQFSKVPGSEDDY